MRALLCPLPFVSSVSGSDSGSGSEGEEGEDDGSDGTSTDESIDGLPHKAELAPDPLTNTVWSSLLWCVRDTR